MTARRKFLIGTAVALCAGPFLALSLLIPLPLTDAQANRMFGRLVRKCAGEDLWVPIVGALPELGLMKHAECVYIFTRDRETVRTWMRDSPRIVVLPRRARYPKNAPRSRAAVFVTPNRWIKGDRVYMSSLDYGGGSLSMHGMAVTVQRSWLGPWMIVEMMWMS